MSTPVLKDLYGIGISPLSIKNKKYAHDEELMANKEAGLLAIYQQDGSVISAEHLLRCKRHFELFTQRCINDGTLGKIYKISPDDNLVQTITATKNIFTDKLTFDSVKKVDFQYLRFGVDFDCFNKTDSSIIFNPNDIRVQINFTHRIEEVPWSPSDSFDPETGEPIPGPEDPNPRKSYNIEETLPELSRKVYAVDYSWYDGDTAKNSIILNSFDIIVPTGFDPAKIGLVIHDILFVLK